VTPVNDQVVWKVLGFLWLDPVEQNQKQGKDTHNSHIGDGGYVISQVSFFNVNLILILFSFVQLNSGGYKNVRDDAKKL
jgi:hypothetical protein